MNLDVLHELIKLCLWEAFIIMTPIMGVALVIGLLTGLLQTITSVQEQSLGVVSKLLSTAVIIWLMAPWMLQRLATFTELFFTRAADLVR